MNSNDSSDKDQSLSSPADITDRLRQHADPKRAAFTAGLAPMIDPARFLGLCRQQIVEVRKSLTPQEAEQFLNSLPHSTYEEDILHVLLLNELRDQAEAAFRLEAFLPYINSWAIADSISMSRLKENDLLELARQYGSRDEEYAARLAVLWIMKRAIKRDDAPFWIDLALGMHADNMTRQLVDVKGWMLCEVMIHRPDLALERLQDPQLSADVRLRAISKCIDSRRILDEEKNRLREIRLFIRQTLRADSSII